MTEPKGKKRHYVVSYVHKNWNREPGSSHAAFEIVYSDPSAAHERALRLKADGHLRVTVRPVDVEGVSS